MKNTLGIDLNDDYGNYNSYTYNASMDKSLNWSDLDPQVSDDSAKFDGVSGQCLMSILAPELASCR